MKQCKFDALWRAEAIRFSGCQFCFAVESLDDACRDGAQGEEPVEDQRPVPPQALGDFLHRRKPAAQGLSAPRLEELARPCRGGVFPEPLELLAKQMGPDALEVHSAVAPAKGLTKQPHLLPKSAAGCSSPSWPARRAVLPGGGTPPHARCFREAACRSRLSESPRRWLSSLEDPSRLVANCLPHQAAADVPRLSRRPWVEAHARLVFAHRFCWGTKF